MQTREKLLHPNILLGLGGRGALGEGRGTSPRPLNEQFGVGQGAARATEDLHHWIRPLTQDRPEGLPRAQPGSEGWDWSHDSAHCAHPASVCCSRVLCSTHPADSRNLGNSMVPIQRSCGRRNLVPWKSVSDAKPQKYQLIFSLQINTHNTVHHSQKTFSSAHFVIRTFGFLSVFYSVCKLRAYYIAAFQSGLLSLLLHWWRK